MAVLHQFRNYSSLSSQNFCSCRFSLELLLDKQQQQQQFVWGNHRFQPRKPMICANNSRDSINVKTGKSVKSNADLCTELREFLSMAGLPQGHVPSFKELLHHGRKDLAFIVRRRGYRVITELLTYSTQGETNTGVKEKVISTCEDKSVGEDQQVDENLLLSSDASDAEYSSCSENGFPPLDFSEEIRGLVKSETSPSLLEKASKFVKDGVLDKIEDADDYINIGTDASCPDRIGEEIEPGSSGGHSLSNEASGQNGTSRDASSLISKLVLPLETPSDDFSSAEGFDQAIPRKRLIVQNSIEDNEREMNRLKAMLHQKELELYQLKEQIEKEKLALSTLQAKAEKEIIKAQKILSAKDEELQTAAECLSGLKEVQIEYLGHAETVEVAGSFNGWHHRIKMESQPLPMSVRPVELRKSQLWSTVIWLYPGIYEIKFVVDGRWMVDPQRESVTRGTIHNNILRVER